MTVWSNWRLLIIPIIVLCFGYQTIASLINTGDKVNIRYDAFPFEKFGQFPGRIISISNVPVSQQEIASYNIAPRLPNGGLIEPYYKVIVALDDIHFRYQSKPLMLSNGLKANVTLFLEKASLSMDAISILWHQEKCNGACKWMIRILTR